MLHRNEKDNGKDDEEETKKAGINEENSLKRLGTHRNAQERSTKNKHKREEERRKKKRENRFHLDFSAVEFVWLYNTLAYDFRFIFVWFCWMLSNGSSFLPPPLLLSLVFHLPSFPPILRFPPSIRMRYCLIPIQSNPIGNNYLIRIELNASQLWHGPPHHFAWASSVSIDLSIRSVLIQLNPFWPWQSLLIRIRFRFNLKRWAAFQRPSAGRLNNARRSPPSSVPTEFLSANSLPSDIGWPKFKRTAGQRPAARGPDAVIGAFNRTAE